MSTFRLALSFDVPSMLSDVDSFAASDWVSHSMHESHDKGWKVLPLRSRGGDAKDWTPGTGGKKEPYADTLLLNKAPYISRVLSSLHCKLNSARLSGVPAGGRIAEHRDNDSEGWIVGSQVRLHVPIITHPDCKLYVAGESCDWRPGRRRFNCR
jgi:hypothetical protein